MILTKVSGYQEENFYIIPTIPILSISKDWWIKSSCKEILLLIQTVLNLKWEATEPQKDVFILRHVSLYQSLYISRCLRWNLDLPKSRWIYVDRAGVNAAFKFFAGRSTLVYFGLSIYSVLKKRFLRVQQSLLEVSTRLLEVSTKMSLFQTQVSTSLRLFFISRKGLFSKPFCNLIKLLLY